MKKIVLLTVSLLAIASMASALSIKDTKHDLSKDSIGSFSDGDLKATTTDQICIFCHTPHNATPAVPLWNRATPALAGLTMYQSATLSTTAQAKLAGGAFDANSISLFCMSCHDGVTTMGAFTNKAGFGAESLAFIGETVASNADLGVSLVNDHPVGFNYNTAATEDSTGLRAIGTASTNLGGSAFFGTTSQELECSSCHKVHNNEYYPFLRTTNTNSALCLACHIK